MLLTEHRGLVRRLLDVFTGGGEQPASGDTGKVHKEGEGFGFTSREPTRVVGFDNVNDKPPNREVSF